MLDCIDSWSLPSFLLCDTLIIYSRKGLSHATQFSQIANLVNYNSHPLEDSNKDSMHACIKVKMHLIVSHECI